MRGSSFTAFVVVVLSLYSCSRNNDTPSPTPNQGMESLVVQDNFNFSTGNNVKLTVNALDASGSPLKFVRIDAYAKNGNDKRLIQTFATDASGYAEAYVSIPTYIDSIQFMPQYLGIPGDITVKISGGIASISYGGTSSGAPRYAGLLKTSTTPILFTVGSTVFKTITGFDNNGVPTNLVNPRDIVDAGFLNDVNATLPEYKPVPQYNSTYLATSNETNVILKELSDVWVTFVHEGAGYRNVLGYYKYSLNKAPLTKEKIDTVFIILPNVSYVGSGGGLRSGDKVKIGRFPANTGIGWVCISDGFRNGTITKNSWNWIFYSDPEFNPETSPTNRQHNVLIFDNTRDKVILGFEDIKRDAGSDNDFNDAVYYVTSNPVTAIATGNLPSMTYASNNLDSDGDGIPDTSDDYPNDATKAFNNRYPSASTFGTMAFEDLWPSKGDYDLNDMVIDYQINQITNAANKVVEVNGALVVMAMGASYHNGFGMALGIPSSAVKQVTTTFKKSTSSLVKHGTTTISSNGLETPANNPYSNVVNEAVFVVFDDGYDILKYTGGGNGVNTTMGSLYSAPDTIHFTMVMATPQNPSVMGNPPYNPFLFVNGDRTKEVHLQNMVPTGKANAKLFMTSQDNTIPSKSKYYKTYKNLPWGVLFLDKFNYPIEGAAIIDAYTYFAPWAESSGSSFTNWYAPTSDGRNQSKIYLKK
jgi:LruC domain-containing protein